MAGTEMVGDCNGCGALSVKVKTFNKGFSHPGKKHNLCVFCANTLEPISREDQNANMRAHLIVREVVRVLKEDAESKKGE